MALPPTNRGWSGFSHRWFRSYTAPQPVETILVGHEQADGEIAHALQATAPAPGVGQWATLGLYCSDDHDLWLDRIESALPNTLLRCEALPFPTPIAVALTTSLRAIRPTAFLFAGGSIGLPAWVPRALPAEFPAPGMLIPRGHGFQVSELVANTAFAATFYFREAA